MSVTINQIRAWPLNGMPASDVSDDTIEEAMKAATRRINAIKRADANPLDVDTALQALSGYYAYLSYLGRPMDNTAGAFENGYFVPSEGTEGVPIIRSMSDVKAKAKYLKETADTFLEIISDINVDAPNEKSIVPFFGKTYGVSDLR